MQQKATQVQAEAATRAQSLDQQTGASTKLKSLCQLGNQYYEKALSSPHGSKVRDFYTKTSKQVLDVHAEAKRIAEEKAGHPVFQKKANKDTSSPNLGQSAAAHDSSPVAAPGYDVSDPTPAVLDTKPIS